MQDGTPYAEYESQSTVLVALAPFDISSADGAVRDVIGRLRSDEAGFRLRYEELFERLKAWVNEGLVQEFEVAQRV